MARPRNLVDWILLIASVLAIGQLALPFAFDYSPVRAIREGDRIWMLAAPFFIAPFLFVVGIRTQTGALTPIERSLAGLLSLTALSITIVFVVLGIWKEGLPTGVREWVGLVALLITIMVGATWRRRSRRVAPQHTPLVGLVLGYAPNAVWCLIGLFGDLQIGGYITVGIVAALLLVAAVMSRE